MDRQAKIYRKNIRYFADVVEENYPDQSGTIINRMGEEFLSLRDDMNFSIGSKNPMDHRIPLCGMFLALIRVMDRQGETYETIRSACLEVAARYITPKNALEKKLKSMQGRFVRTWLFRLIVHQLKKRVKEKTHPDGFAVDIITSSEQTFGLGYGIDIMECGICKLFNKHSAGHYAKILCEVDQLTSSLAGLDLIRTGTIANGAAKCDFRFKLKQAT